MSNFVTAKQAFERAYGPLPGSAPLHLGAMKDKYSIPVFGLFSMSGNVGVLIENGRIACTLASDSILLGPDISDRPASAFIGFFDEAYDNAVRELEAGE